MKSIRKKRNQNRRYKYKNNIDIALNAVCVCGLKALKAKNAPKNQHTIEYINCIHKYITTLNNNLKKWMTWDNLGIYNQNGPRTWQIDHRRPCDSFNLDDEEQKICAFIDQSPTIM